MARGPQSGPPGISIRPALSLILSKFNKTPAIIMPVVNNAWRSQNNHILGALFYCKT